MASPTVVNSEGQRLIYEFPSKMFIENICCCSDGTLLFTSLSEPRLYWIDPNRPDAAPVIVHEFPQGKTLSGITEFKDNVFAINRSRFLGNRQVEKGTSEIWTVSFAKAANHTSHEDHSFFQTPHAVEWIVAVPAAHSINGLTHIPQTSILLGADSQQGKIHRINLETKMVDVVFDDPLLAPGLFIDFNPIGVNGVRVHKQFLYLTVSARGLFGRYPLDSEGNVKGRMELLFQLLPDKMVTFDDFCLDEKGTAFLGTHPCRISKITPSGVLQTLANGEEDQIVTFPTSCCRGKGGEEAMLYICCGCNFKEGVMTGGKLVSLKLED